MRFIKTERKYLKSRKSKVVFMQKCQKGKKHKIFID